jgi:predicted nucleotide-binding protein
MARKKGPDEPLPPAKLTISRDDLAQQLGDRIEKGEELAGRVISSAQDLDRAWYDHERWSSYNTELLVRSFDNRSVADDYDWSPGAGIIRLNPSLEERVEEFQTSLADQINRLHSILERLSLVEEAPRVSSLAGPSRKLSTAARRSVFIVHGRDQGTREAVARFIERIGLDPVILHERPSQGRTLIEKFEANSEVAFAVVLLTADDQCHNADDPNLPTSRARQNVIFELGYFFGALGRHRVAALYTPEVELPSDISGLAYIELDAREAWKFHLAKELTAAGLPVDSQRLLG